MSAQAKPAAERDEAPAKPAPEPEPWRQRAHAGLIFLGAFYLLGVWLEGTGSSLPSLVLARTPVYFLQIAALFPRAAVNVIDYRVEGWVCREHAWKELDPRPYFPIDPDDKENRFQRVMHFFREHRVTMNALDDYLVHAHGTAGRADGIPDDDKLGGIRTLSLRLPLPNPGDPLTRMTRKPLAEYPKEVRKDWYFTKKSTRAARCGYPLTPGTPSTTPAPAASHDVGPRDPPPRDPEEAPE